MSENNTSAGTVMLAVLGGAVVGAGLALLYAPHTGRKTRKDLMDMGEDAKDYANDLIEKAEDAIEKVRKNGEAWMKKLDHKAQAAHAR